MIKFTWKFFRSKKRQMIFIVMLTFASSLVGIFAPYFNGLFIDGLIQSPTSKTIIFFTSILCSLGLSGAIVGFVSRMITVKFLSYVEYEMNAATIQHIQKIPLTTFYRKFSAPQLAQQITTDTNVIVHFVANNFVSAFMNIAVFILLCIILLNINISMLALSFGFIPIYLLTYKLLQKPLFKHSTTQKVEHSAYFKTTFEQLNQVQNIKVNASFDHSQTKLEQGFKKYLYALLKNARITQLFTSLDSTISLAFQVCVLIIGGYQIINGEMTVGQYTIVNTYFSMLLNIVKYFFGMGKSYQEANSSFHRLKDIYMIEEELNGNKRILEIESVKVKDVRFSYNPLYPIINLTDMNFEFKRGNIYCISGRNGAGKTTLLQIIIGVIQDVQSGQVLYDSVPTYEYDMYYLRKNIVTVLLQSQMYPDDIVKDYLEFEIGMPIELIHRSLVNSHLSSLFASHEFDYRSLLDTKVENLSGGEKQKIRLMRVLLQESSVLILDEPTTSLDVSSINLLHDYLKKVKNEKIIILTNHDSHLDSLVDVTYEL